MLMCLWDFQECALRAAENGMEFNLERDKKMMSFPVRIKAKENLDTFHHLELTKPLFWI